MSLHPTGTNPSMQLDQNQISERNLGPQPLIRIMDEHGLRAHDLVEKSSDHLNHKMVARACKGRRLTANVKNKIRDALSAATGQQYKLVQLFNY